MFSELRKVISLFLRIRVPSTPLLFCELILSDQGPPFGFLFVIICLSIKYQGKVMKSCQE